jgi:hypothetical protein
MDSKDEILRRRTLDTEMRNKATEDVSLWDDSVDLGNTAFLKNLVNTSGWPKISDVGTEVSEAAWLLAQHADRDPGFQQQCLDLMKSLPDGEVSKRNTAYLEDRILVAQGKPQLYGTQFKGAGKDLTVSEVEDRPNLDMRRKKMGLSTFAEYEKIMIDNYGK